MHCPLCLKKNVYNAIIRLTSTCYICDDESCILCLNGDEFNNLSSTNNNIIEISVESNHNAVLANNQINDDSTYLHDIDDTLTQTLCNEQDRNDDANSDSSDDCVITGQYQLPVDVKPHIPLAESVTTELRVQLEDIAITHTGPVKKALSKANGKRGKKSLKNKRNTQSTESQSEEESKQPKVKKGGRKPRKSTAKKTKTPDFVQEDAFADKEMDIAEPKAKKRRAPKVSKTVMGATNKDKKRCGGAIMTSDDAMASEQLPSTNQPAKILNWLKMPVVLKTESKIVSMIMLYLDLFPRPSPLIDRVKLHYRICNALANRFPLSLATPMGFSLTEQLLALAQSFPAGRSTASSASIDERVVDMLRQYCQQSDPDGAEKCEFVTTAVCKSCDQHSSSIVADYFLSLPRDKTYFRMTRDKISYSEPCRRCDGSVDKKIAITKLPQLMVVHCPDGLKNLIDRYDTDLLVNRRHFQLGAVIQCGPGPAAVSLSEERFSRQRYAALATISRPASMPTWCWHFRQTSGWCSMSETSPHLCQPSPSLTVDQTANIRLLVYVRQQAPKTDPVDEISIARFIDKFQKKHNVDLDRVSCGAPAVAAASPGDTGAPVNVSLNVVDLNQFRCDGNSNSYFISSPSASSSCSSSVSSPRKKAASIHSRSTVSRCNGAETDGELSVDIGRQSPAVSDSGISSLLHKICFSKQHCADPTSSSGVSSCSSLFDDRRRQLPSPAASLYSHHSSIASQSSQAVSSISSLNILRTKRSQCTIDDLIEKKRLKVLSRPCFD